MKSRREFVTTVAASTTILAGCIGFNQSTENKAPEDLTREFYQALDEGDIDTIHESIHDESPTTVPDSINENTISIEILDVTEVTPQEVQNHTDYGTNREIVEQSIERDVGYIPEEENYTIVLTDMIEEGENIIYPNILINEDGRWYILAEDRFAALDTPD